MSDMTATPDMLDQTPTAEEGTPPPVRPRVYRRQYLVDRKRQLRTVVLTAAAIGASFPAARLHRVWRSMADANRLSADGSSRVLLLEAGGSDRTPIVRIPAGEIFAIASHRYNWNYDAEPDPSLNGRVTKWPGGKVLGGSSSINGMIFQRGNPMDYEKWARRPGMENWDYAHCLPYFKRMEHRLIGGDQWRGDDGPLRPAAHRPRDVRQSGASAATVQDERAKLVERLIHGVDPRLERLGGPSRLGRLELRVGVGERGADGEQC